MQCARNYVDLVGQASITQIAAWIRIKARASTPWWPAGRLNGGWAELAAGRFEPLARPLPLSDCPFATPACAAN